MDIVRQELIAGNRVDVSEFGVFQALKQSEYILIDLGTGERYLMPRPWKWFSRPLLLLLISKRLRQAIRYTSSRRLPLKRRRIARLHCSSQRWLTMGQFSRVDRGGYQ